MSEYLSSTSTTIRCISAALASIFIGYSLGCLNMINDKLAIEYNYSNPNLQKGILTGILSIGSMLGCILTGPLS